MAYKNGRRAVTTKKSWSQLKIEVVRLSSPKARGRVRKQRAQFLKKLIAQCFWGGRSEA